MRITKKFSGVSSIGKQVFTPKENIESPELVVVHKQLDELEKKFISTANLHPPKHLMSLADYSSAALMNPLALASLATPDIGLAIPPLILPRVGILGAVPSIGPDEGIVPGPLSSAASATSAMTGSAFDVNVYLAQRQMQTFAQARAYALAQAHAFESYAVERAQMHDHSGIYSKTTSSIYANEAAVGRQVQVAKSDSKSEPFSANAEEPSDRVIDQNAPHLLLNFASHIVEGLPMLQGGSSQPRGNVNGSTSAETNSDSTSDSDKKARKSDTPEEQRSGPSASDISETSSEENSSHESGQKKKRADDISLSDAESVPQQDAPPTKMLRPSEEKIDDNSAVAGVVLASTT